MSVSQSTGNRLAFRPSKPNEEQITQTTRRVIKEYTYVGDASALGQKTVVSNAIETQRPVQMTESVIVPSYFTQNQLTYPVASDSEFREVEKRFVSTKDIRSPQQTILKPNQMTPHVSRIETQFDHSFKSERKDAESVPNSYNYNIKVIRGERSSTKNTLSQRQYDELASSRVLQTNFERTDVPAYQSVRTITTQNQIDGDFRRFEQEVGLHNDQIREVTRPANEQYRYAPEQVADTQSNRSDYVLYEESKTAPIDRNARWVNSIPNIVGDNRGARGSHPHLPFGAPSEPQLSYQDYATTSSYQRQVPTQQVYRLSQEQQWEHEKRNSRPASRGDALINSSQLHPVTQEPSIVLRTVTYDFQSVARPGSRGVVKTYNDSSINVASNEPSYLGQTQLTAQVYDPQRPASAHHQHFGNGHRTTEDSSLSIPFTDTHDLYGYDNVNKVTRFEPKIETVKQEAQQQAAVSSFDGQNGIKFLKLENIGSASHDKVELVLEGIGRYTGGVRFGQLDGYGILSTADGRSILYEGEFEENHFNGVGIMYNDPSGASDVPFEFSGHLPDNWNKYEGLFLRSKREGFGELFFKDGSHYSGEFSNDKANGYGTFTLRDGRKHTGVWKDNRQVARE